MFPLEIAAIIEKFVPNQGIHTDGTAEAGRVYTYYDAGKRYNEFDIWIKKGVHAELVRPARRRCRRGRARGAPQF